MTTVIDTGGEVQIDGYEDDLRADRIELLDSGMVKLVFKNQYERWYVPREKVVIRTHTDPNVEEFAAWW